jgi:hypothetical protein
MLRFPQRLVPYGLAFASTVAIGILASLLMIGSSEAQPGSMHNCPPAGKWSIGVWEGSNNAAATDALATCGAGAVDAAYSLDSATGAWSRWFAGKPDVSNLAQLNDLQGVLALGSATGPAPTPVVTATPAATVTPAVTMEEVQLLNYRSHETEYGSLRFYGEVSNNGNTEVASVEVVITLLDGTGKVIGTGSNYTQPDCLSPGERGAFAISVLDPPDTWADERVQLQWSPMSEWLRDMCYKAFSVSGVTVTSGDYGGLVVRGQVKNTGAQAASLTQVTFVGYDTAGKVLVVDFSFADIDPLAPGNSSPFEISFIDLDDPPASHKVTVQAWVD